MCNPGEGRCASVVRGELVRMRCDGLCGNPILIWARADDACPFTVSRPITLTHRLDSNQICLLLRVTTRKRLDTGLKLQDLVCLDGRERAVEDETTQREIVRPSGCECLCECLDGERQAQRGG